MDSVQIVTVYAVGGVAGAAIGWFSHRFQALFLGGLFAVFAGVGAMGGQLAPLLKMGAAATGVGFLQMPGYLFSLMPIHVQNAIMVALFVGVIARIATWYHARFRVKAKTETRAERRARVLREHDYADDLAGPSLRRPSASPIGSVSAQNAAQDIRSLAGLR